MILISTYKIKINAKRPKAPVQVSDHIPVWFPDYVPAPTQNAQKRVYRNKSRRKPYVYAIVAAVFIFVVLTVGILTTQMLIDYEPDIPFSDTDTTIYDEKIHNIEFELGNAIYCHGCMTEQKGEIENVDEPKKNVCKSTVKEVICFICKSEPDGETAI